MSAPSNNDNVIDSRDVMERIAELTGEREALEAELEEATDDGKAERITLKEWDDENGEELKALEALREEAESCGDWRYGATLIRDSYFEQYAQELADDLGALKPQSWPYTCIDWEKAASELQQDYTSVDFDGVAYWVRS